MHGDDEEAPPGRALRRGRVRTQPARGDEQPTPRAALSTPVLPSVTTRAGGSRSRARDIPAESLLADVSPRAVDRSADPRSYRSPREERRVCIDAFAAAIAAAAAAFAAPPPDTIGFNTRAAAPASSLTSSSLPPVVSAPKDAGGQHREAQKDARSRRYRRRRTRWLSKTRRDFPPFARTRAARGP